MADNDAPLLPPDPDPNDPATLALLHSVAASTDDAVIVTDLDAVVRLWNAAAERLYGIPAGEALGRVIYELTEGRVVGEVFVPIAEPRQIALTAGSWHGRVLERATIGRAIGREVVVETSLSRLEAADGTVRGVLSIKRDITASYRLELELATLGTLATATGHARTRHEIAQTAIDLLCAATAASGGMIFDLEGTAVSVEAFSGVEASVAQQAAGLTVPDSPIHDAVRTRGTVFVASTDQLPVREESRSWIASLGIAAIAVVGIHRGDELIGSLAFAWDDPDAPRPSSAVLLQAGAHVGQALENARLIEEMTVRVDAERALIRRLDVLDELTRVGQAVRTADELAERSAILVGEALGAVGTAYGLLNSDGSGYATSSFIGVRQPLAAWLTSASPAERSAFRRWRAGEGSILERFERGHVTDETLEIARQAGVTAYAAIPIRVDDELAGGIVAYFDRPQGELQVDHQALDSVARIVGISLANFRHREQLEGSEARYRTLFDVSPDAYLLCDLEGGILDSNAAADRLYGGPLAGMAIDAFLDIDPTETERRREAVDRGEHRRYTGTARRKDGTYFPRESEASLVRIGEEPRYLVTVRDLTERQRLQTELVQAQKMETVGILVSGVAHELNNPIASIVGLSSLIGRDPSLSDDLRESARLLVDEAHRAGQIVRTFLDFVRSRPPERHLTAIKPLLESVRELQSYAHRGHVEWVLDIEPGLPQVAIDRSQIQQVLLNLTTNAIQAMLSDRPSGTLEIAARRGPGNDGHRTIRISVTDDGPGVAASDRTKLFVPFFTTKSPGEGTGLGLPVSFDIVRRHEGRLRYEPAPGGRGSRFIVELPVELPASVGQDAPSVRTANRRADGANVVDRSPSGDPEGRRPRALILDDEEAIRTFLRKALKAAGFDPVVAVDGETAVAEIRAGPIDVALVDHRMPGMTGVETYEAAVAIRPELAGRWIFMSGDVLNPELHAFAEANDIRLLAKPFDLSAVTGAVAAVVERHGLID